MRAYGLTELQRIVALAFKKGKQCPRGKDFVDPPDIRDILHELEIEHLTDENKRAS